VLLVFTSKMASTYPETRSLAKEDTPMGANWFDLALQMSAQVLQTERDRAIAWNLIHFVLVVGKCGNDLEASEKLLEEPWKDSRGF
jgi:hypothetical protein